MLLIFKKLQVQTSQATSFDPPPPPLVAFSSFFLYMYNRDVRKCRSGLHLMSRYCCSFHQADMYEYAGPIIFLVVVIGFIMIHM